MKSLDFGSEDENDTLKINKKFARKFEHNKSREEFHKLKDRYGDEDDSDSEVEDEAGDLVTGEIDEGITRVLDLIRNNPEKLKDKSLKFFPEVDSSAQPALASKPKDKKLSLKEYVLTQNNHDSDEEETFVEQQSRHKRELIDEINAQGEKENEDDDFLVKRKEEREVEAVALPNPDKDAEGFLKAFVDNKGWIDGNAYTEEGSVPSYKQVVGDDSDGDVELAEKYESAYNFRFEDPSSVEIMSYARDQNTLRRKADSTRQRQREKERAEKKEQENQRQKDLQRLRKLKVQQVTSRLEQLKQVLGEDMVTAEDLEGDWNDDEWDQRMKRLFNDEFYGADDDFKPQSVDDLEKEFGGIEEEEEEQEDEAEAPKKQEKPSKEHKKDLKKLSKTELKRKAQEFVDANNDLLAEEVHKPTTSFKYRTVEAEDYGLSTEDILLADDRQLNMYVGLKKLASFRDSEQVAKDHKRYGKRRRLRQWRQEVWGNEEGPGEERWNALKQDAQPKNHKHKHKSKKHKSK